MHTYYNPMDAINIITQAKKRSSRVTAPSGAHATPSDAALLPPQNLEAESSVLGSILLDRDAMIKMGDVLTADDFYSQAHGRIYEAMVYLFEHREPIDVLSVSNKLEENGALTQIGGRSYLVSLSNGVPTASNVLHYAKIVQKKSLLRRLIGASRNISELAYSEDEDVEKTLDQAEQELFSVSQKSLKKNFVPIPQILTETFERIDQLHQQKGQIRGIPTGFTDLDNLMAGMQRSDLIILAARPSMGKTAFCLDIARFVAVSAKVPVGIFSLEMSKEQLVDRLLCSQAGVDMWKMRTGQLSHQGEVNDFQKIGEAMGVLSEAPIFIDDTPGTNIMQIRTKARRLQSEHGLGFIVVDYLQLIEGRTNKSDNRVQEVSEISRALKGIARELNVPVLALSQLSRAVETRNEPIPQLSDLRDSGSIEQDADVVMFIYRQAMYKKDLDASQRNIAEIHVKKQRNGPTGAVNLFFDDTRVTFKNLDMHMAPPMQ